MIERFVERVRTDARGRVTALAWDGGEIGAEDACEQIQQRLVDYRVRMVDGSARRLEVVYGPHGPSLFASWDGRSQNRLADLPRM